MSDHVDLIMDVMGAAFDPRWGEAWTRRQVSNSLVFANTHYLLIDENGECPVGDGPLGDCPVAGFVLSRNAPGEEELLLIAVRPELQGRGLGAKLLESFKAEARLRGAEQVFLEMRCNNPAESSYRRAGFEPIGKRRDYYLLSDGTRLDAITFACAL